VTGPSEFGGSDGIVQPPFTPDGDEGHQPTAAEQLMLRRRTGTIRALAPEDGGQSFAGLLPISADRKELLDPPE